MDLKDPFDDPYDLTRTEIYSPEDYDKEAARERASVLWLLSKAFDGVIPSDLREPFYRDYEQHRRLKPKIVHSLANAELYSLALANIYSDPNFHNLDHHGIIQALMRKGVCLMEMLDSPITETVLVQTAPIKLSAHLTVIEGMIMLYIREVLIPEKIVDVVRCFSSVDIDSEMPVTAEEAAVLWINKCCVTLEQEIRQEFRTQEPASKLPSIPVLQEISDISDGCSLAAVICFYCRNYMNWQDVCWNSPMSLGDSIYNLQLVKRFCCDNLSRQIDFLTLEDLLYVHSSIKDNVLVFVAELLFAFVIWPASCVTRHMSHEQQESEHDAKSRSNSIPSHKSHQISCSAIPNLRSDSYGGSSSSLPELRPSCGAAQSSRESLEKAIAIKRSTERLRMSPRLQRTNSSGKVNGFKSSSTSVADFSTNALRLSNSGNVRRDIQRSCSTTEGESEHATHDRAGAGLQDYYQSLASNDGPIRSGSLTNLRDNRSWRDGGNDRSNLKSSSSSQSSGICVSETNKQLSKTSFAKLCKEPDPKSSNINIVYMQHEREGTDSKLLKTNFLKKGKSEKRTTFAVLPNTTTWQQQRVLSSNSSQADSGHETPIESSDPSLNIQLANLRMKLEEKRRRIELEKKRMESLWKRERQRLGKVAFLQAVRRADGTDVDTPDSGTGKDVCEAEAAQTMNEPFEPPPTTSNLVRRMSFQEIAEDLDNVQKKWLEQREAAQRASPNETGEGHMTEDFEASIEQLNSSLCDLQADISRISFQQEQVENMLQDSVEDASHFFLHNEPSEIQCQDSPVKSYFWSKNPSFFSTPSSHNFTSISMSPQRQPYQHTIERSVSKEDSSLSSFPYKKQDDSLRLDELYAKVVKPVGRPKSKSPGSCHSLPVEQSAESEVAFIQKNFESPVKMNSQKAMDVHSPRMMQHAGRDRPKQIAADDDQGFYISFDDQSKKTTIKWQRPTVNGKRVQLQPPAKKDAEDSNSFGFVIGADLVHPDPETEVEMAKKKELIMNLSIKRRQDGETQRLVKEQEYARLKEEEQRKRDHLESKREEERQRRQAILDQYRHRKLQDESEKEGGKDIPSTKAQGPPKTRSSVYSSKRNDNRICTDFTKPIADLRTRVTPRRAATRGGKPRPKSSYVASAQESALFSIDGSIVNKRNSQFIGTCKGMSDFDIDSLNSGSTTASSRDREFSPTNGHAQLSPSQMSGDVLLKPSEGRSSDGASDTTSNSSNAAVMVEYTGPKLFVKPAAKSNKGIIINAINTVLAGPVNAESKKKVLEEIGRSESKHFLILFRDSGCQFRALYTYNPDTDEVLKMYGIGPRSVADKAIEKFYKYNSGGKCFSQVHTKHLTVTIDAFTLPNSLWIGKKVVPQRKDLY